MTDIYKREGNILLYMKSEFELRHPWAGEDLSLKIDEHDQTIWNCILEL